MSHRVEPKPRRNGDPGLKKQCTDFGDRFYLCLNPLCGNALESRTMHVKYFCSMDCKQAVSIMRRAAAMLVPLGEERAWKILKVFIS